MLRKTRARLGLMSLMVASLALHGSAAWCLPLSVSIDRYVLSEGVDHTYFTGKLLTAGDLNSEQSYLLGAKRYLGPPGVPLSELFRLLGSADLVLEFDDELLTGNNVSAPTDPGAPQHDDMLFLDTDAHTWRGRLYVPGPNGSAGGVFEDLSGTFSDLRLIPEPSSATLLGMAALLGVMRRKRAK